MTNEEIAEQFIKNALKAIDEDNLEDAEVTLIEARFKCNTDRVTSLLKEVQEKKALLNIKMNENTRNVINDNSDSREANPLKEATMSEKKDEMIKNVFMMRYYMLSMQVKVAKDRIEARKDLGFLYSADEIQHYKMEAKTAFSTEKIKEACLNLSKAEQLYEKMAEKLFPAKPKKDEKPSNEYLRITKKPVTVSNRPGVTVRGTYADVKACIEKARIAFDANELEKAKKWLVKSERMMHTVNARELLDKVLAAIATRDAPKEVPNVDPELNPETVADPNSTVDPNLEDISDQRNSTPISTAVPDNIIGANKFVDNADKAYAAGDFKNSERYLLKAQRMNPSLNLETKLKQVKDAIDNLNDTSRENPVADNTTREPERSEQTNNLNKDEADTYIQIAINALNDNNYERALIFLGKAETVYPSDYAKNMLQSVLDAKAKQNSYASTCKRYFSSNERKGNCKDELDKLKQAIKKDINAGNLEEAEKKLQTPGFVKCVQLDPLRKEVNYLLKVKASSSIKELQKPKPTKIVPPSNETLRDTHKQDADTCIDIADKAYYDGDLKTAVRFLKKAERLYPSERGKDILKKVEIALEEKRRQESEKPRTSDTDCNQAVVERTQETHFDHEVQTLLNEGMDEMQKRNYYAAELSFKKAYSKFPCQLINELLENVGSIIKENNAAESDLRRSVEGTPTGSQNGQTWKPNNKSESNIIALANMYTACAENDYMKGRIKEAENNLRLAEAYSTMRSRRLLIEILKAKHSYDFYSDDDDAGEFVEVRRSKKMITAAKKYSEKDYIADAEDKFIEGQFKEALKLLLKVQVCKHSYLKELKKEIDIMVKKNGNSFMDKVYNFFS